MQIKRTNANGVTSIQITTADDGRILLDPDAPALFRLRGIADDAIGDMLDGMVDGDAESALKLGTMLPSRAMPTRTDGVITYEAVLTETVTWICGPKGGALRIDALPDTIAQSVIGLPIGRVVEHPAISPERIIDRIEADGTAWLLHLSGAPVPYEDLMHPDAVAEKTKGRNNADGFSDFQKIGLGIISGFGLLSALLAGVRNPMLGIVIIMAMCIVAGWTALVLMLLDQAGGARTATNDMSASHRAGRRRTRRNVPIVIDPRLDAERAVTLAEAVKNHLQRA